MQTMVSIHPFSTTTGSVLSSANSNNANTSAQVDSAKVLIIAISGCSSSGKTLLSLLLKDIFTDLDFSCPGITNSSKASRPLSIHEDNYFVDKNNCPFVTFNSTLADSSFILKSLSNENLGHYYLHLDNNHTPIDDVHLQTLNLAKQPLWRVNGPDTDCWEAIDVPALIEVSIPGDLNYISNASQVLGAIKKNGIAGEYHQGHTGKAVEAEVKRWAELVREMQQVVKQWAVKEDTITHSEITRSDLDAQIIIDPKARIPALPALCFVEGFLLFSDPDATDEQYVPYENNFDSMNDNTVTPYDVLALNIRRPKICRPLTTDSSDYSSHNIAPTRIPTLTENKALMNKFDIKIFLPTSNGVAKARRFSRKPYMDYPLGSRREGELWKTEGYFNGVVWPNYERFHRWLLTGSKDEPRDREFRVIDDAKSLADDVASIESRCNHWQRGDIHVREVDAVVEDTVRWAVTVILVELSKRAQARRAEEI
jgi:hypothetical protein